MRFVRNLPIRRKVMAVMMLTASVALLLAGATLLSYELRGYHAKIERDLSILTKIMGSWMAPAIEFNDEKSAGEVLEALKAEPQILGARLFRSDGTTFASFVRPGYESELPAAPGSDGYHVGGNRITHVAALKDDEEKFRLGTLVLLADYSAMHERLKSYSGLLGIVLLTSGLVALVLSAKLQSYITRPILSLANATKVVTDKRDYSARVPQDMQDELGQLIAGFNGMLEQIQTRDEELQRAHDLLEKRVAERTAELQQEVSERMEAQNKLADSLSLMTATLESTADGILVVNGDGKMVSCNHKFVEMWGIPHEVMATRDDRALRNFVLRQLRDPEEFMRKVEELYRDPEAESHDSVHFADGRVFERYSQPHRLSGAPGGRVWSFRDVTERATSEERIREQANLLDLAQDGIVVRDMNDMILYWNKGAERIYGWKADEVVGSQMGRLFFSNGEKFLEAKRAIIERGEWTGELPHLTKGGREVITESRWTLLRDETGKPKSILGINTDVTERKKLEAQFLRSQRMESIGTLAGGVAHDLNNVLAPILLSAELIRLRSRDMESQGLLEAIENSAKRGADLVRQILYFARGVDGKRVALQTERIVKEVHKIARDTFPKNIEVRCSLAADVWPIMGDATQLHQVLLNLAVNARDAMPEGGRLIISAENYADTGSREELMTRSIAGPHVLVRISDTGTGIPAHIKDKIFEPFFTTKELGKGTGLGLSTTLAIVKAHAGLLELETAEGKGTTFKLYFPAVPAVPPSAQDEVKPNHLGAGETILLVEDEPSVMLVTKQVLEGSGYRVLTASDGAAAVALYAERKSEIALVFTDMMMPGLDGAATIRALKGLNTNVRVLAASGMMTEERMTKASEAGATGFLRKPYTRDAMLEALRQVLDKEPRTNGSRN